MIRTKKIYYLPGLITLIFLPILIVTKTKIEIDKRKNYCIEYFTLLESDRKFYNYSIPAKRKYIEVNIDGNKIKDSLKFLLIQNFARGIDQSKDTVWGMKIFFGEKIKYSTFVNTLNELLKSKVQTYVPINDTIFVYYMNRTDLCKDCNLPNDWSCTKLIYLIDDNRSVEERQSQLWIARKNTFFMYLHYWPIFLLYTILVILTILRSINDYQENKDSTIIINKKIK